MNDFLWQMHHRLVKDTVTEPRRFVYPQLSSQARLIGVVGPRGVGKTTLLLQHLKNEYDPYNQAFYISADNTYFNENSLLEFVHQMLQRHDIQCFYIDEIHKYPNWNQELKNLYDAFPNLKIIFSGSSSINLLKGTYDLSRRAQLVELPGLSFREYLNFKLNTQYEALSLDHLVNNHQAIAADLSHSMTILRHFEDYLLFGYYPNVFDIGQDLIYSTLGNVVEQSIYEDIAHFYNLKTHYLSHFKRILNFLATIPPGQIKTNTIATRLGLDNKTIDYYLDILHKTRLIYKLFAATQGSRALSKPSKIYMNNTTLLAAFNRQLNQNINSGTLREIAFLQAFYGTQHQVYYPKQADFEVHDMIFEVGGPNKGHKQLQQSNQPTYIVQDNQVIGFANTLPLYLLGFLY